MKRVFLLAAIAAITACRGAKDAEEINLTGAGATFQYPLQSKWGAEFTMRNPNVKVNYQSIGSGGGIRQLIADTVHFGATDSPMTDEQIAEANAAILHIPVTLGAVAVVVNLPEVAGTIRFPANVIADIFLGKISNWKDPAIAQANPGVNFPERNITVVHRSDGSGTTAIFADFLAKTSDEWRTKVGAGTSLAWPVGLGAKGNEGVAGLIKQTPGAIGYVELTYAIQNRLATAAVENPLGEFVEPTIEAVTAAAAAYLDRMPEDMRLTITNAEGHGAYPISGFSWVIVRRDQKNCRIAKALIEYLWWAVHEGQKFTVPLHYAPLPENAVKRCESMLREVRCEGKSVL